MARSEQKIWNNQEPLTFYQGHKDDLLYHRGPKCVPNIVTSLVGTAKITLTTSNASNFRINYALHYEICFIVYFLFFFNDT